MSDDIYKALLSNRGKGKVYRRKRVHQGEVFADQNPPTMQEVHRGEWCSRCKIRHPYNGSKRLLTQYERRDKAFVLMWLCPVSGDVVGELWLGGSRVRPEGEDQADDSGGVEPAD